MGDPIVLLWLAISIAIILVLILKLKMNAALAMFVGALFMGFASGEGLSATVSNISAGFGNTMKGFGVMLGQLIADVGAVQTIANKILKAFGKRKPTTRSAQPASSFLSRFSMMSASSFSRLWPSSSARRAPRRSCPRSSAHWSPVSASRTPSFPRRPAP
mgnify:CR=1 FL=1